MYFHTKLECLLTLTAKVEAKLPTIKQFKTMKEITEYFKKIIFKLYLQKKVLLLYVVENVCILQEILQFMPLRDSATVISVRNPLMY